jgi:hypothetical protein
VCGLDGDLTARHDQRVMSASPSARRPPARWPAIGLLSLTLGILAVGASFPLMMLEDSGWPWTASIRNEAGNGSSAELVHDNGKTETFAGTREEVDAWIARRQVELKKEYGLDKKIAAGRALSVTGLILLAVGVGSLPWRLAVRLRGQPRRVRSTTHQHQAGPPRLRSGAERSPLRRTTQDS